MGETLKGACMCGVFVAAVLLFLVLVADCIALPITLLSSTCNDYRAFEGGAGEMTYCILYPADDDMEFSFDHGSDNIARRDSTAYLLAPPFAMHRETHSVKARFDDDDFERYHYFFIGDSIEGSVTCSGSCTIEVTSRVSICRTTWNSTLYNYSYSEVQTDVRDDAQADADFEPGFAGLLGKKKKRYSSSSNNRCRYTSYSIYKGEVPSTGGTLLFSGRSSFEAPVLVSVTDGLFDDPTGSISYSVTHTVINLTNVVKQCNEYKCLFGNLSNQGRVKTYVAVNKFSDDMTNTYTVYANYRPSKELNNEIAIGFGIATGVVLGLVILGIGAVFVIRLFNEDDSKDNKDGNEMKTVQNSDDTPAGDSETPGDDNPPPAENPPVNDAPLETV